MAKELLTARFRGGGFGGSDGNGGDGILRGIIRKDEKTGSGSLSQENTDYRCLMLFGDS